MMERRLKVYVAGPSAELGRCKEIAASLRAAGIDVFDGWMHAVEAHGADGPELTPEERRDHAVDDLRCVAMADLVVVVTRRLGRGTSVGAAIEAGAALALGKPTVTIGDGPLHPIFGELVLRAFHDSDYSADARRDLVTFLSGYAAGFLPPAPPPTALERPASATRAREPFVFGSDDPPEGPVIRPSEKIRAALAALPDPDDLPV